VPIFFIIFLFFNFPFLDVFYSFLASYIPEITSMFINELTPEHSGVDCSSLVVLAVRTLGLFGKPLINAVKMEDMTTLSEFTDSLILFELTLAYTTDFLLILLVEGTLQQ
jgi:hypothetical protein